MLLYLLGGLVFPTSGRVTVFGLDRWKSNFAIRKRCTFLPRETHFGACYTAWEYFLLVGEVYGLTQEETAERVKPLCESMSLLPHLTKPIKVLSPGLMRKVGLVGAFLPPVELRFFEQPFDGSIDQSAAESLVAWLRESKKKGETLVATCPLFDPVQRREDALLRPGEPLSDRFLILDHGALIAQLNWADVIASAGGVPDSVATVRNVLGSVVPAASPLDPY